MPRKRTNQKVNLKLSIWKKDGDLYSVDPAEFLELIKSCGRSEDDIKARMGEAYRLIFKLMSGDKIDIWEASMVEWGISS